jgi:hypothetical protein
MKPSFHFFVSQRFLGSAKQGQRMKSEKQHSPTLEENYIGTMVLSEYFNFQDF